MSPTIGMDARDLLALRSEFRRFVRRGNVKQVSDPGVESASFDLICYTQ